MQSRRVGWLVSALLLVTAIPMLAQERFGGLTGTVTDPSAAALPGATITVTNTASGAMRTVVSGGDGTFEFRDLEPGRYNVSVELQGFQTMQANDVLVLLGRSAQLNAQLKLGQVSETVQVTADAVRQIDMKSTTIAHNVTSEELDRMPKARTFQSVAIASPGVNQGDIEGGIQVNGASGAENTYTVDGVNTNSLLYGSSRQNTVFEYVEEVQVKTGGISAEYGGALGGVISAVTKSGGNKFSGEGHWYYIGNKLSAAPVPRIQLDPVTDATVFHPQDTKQKNDANEVGGSVGGPIMKNHLFFYGSISPRFQSRTNNYLFSNGTEPNSISSDTTFWQVFGKATYSGNRMQANASILTTPTKDTGILPAYNGAQSLWRTSTFASNASLINQGYQIEQTNFSGNFDFYLTNSSFVSVRGGLFSDNYFDTGVPNTTSVFWNAPSIGVPGVPVELQQPTGYQNITRTQITSKDLTKTGLFQIDYNESFKAAGQHTIKGGFGLRHTTNDVNSLYPGGYVLLDWGLTFSQPGGGGTGTYGYYEVDNRGTSGIVTADMPQLYVQDTWTVNNRLTLNLGVRSEKETIPSFRTDIKENAFVFGWGDKVAPRLGATYDVRGDGKIKAYASWGRYFDWVKYELARGSFGGDVWQIYYRSLDTTDVYNLSLANKPGVNLWTGGPTNLTIFRDRRVPNFNTVDPNIKPMSQDELNLGTEFQLNPTMALTVNYVHNNLRRTIEDIGSLDATGNEVYFEANPGEGIATHMYSTGLTPAALNTTPTPVRKYDALDVTLSRRFAQNWFGSANLVISRLYGNYAGLANSDEILTPTSGTSSTTAQQQGGSIARPGTSAGRAWDLDELEWDSHGNHDPQGRLATDRPVVAKFYGAYMFPFHTQVGLFQYVGSGTPVNTVVNTTNTIPVFVNGRNADMGRTPVLSHTDLLLSHELNVMGRNKLRFELNVINIFNQKTATHIFNSYNKGYGNARADSAINLSQVDLSKGYDYKALVLASPSGANALDPRYGQPDLWQPGTQGQFSVKFIF
jgi:outer membrane receptor protein involved in Fe transport